MRSSWPIESGLNMSTPTEDANASLDRQLRDVLQPSLPQEADRRIRARLAELPIPKDVPPWMSESHAGKAMNAERQNPWRQNWLSGAAAALIFVAGGLVLFVLASRETRIEQPAKPEMAKDSRHGSTPSQEVKPEVVKEEDKRDGPATLGKDFESPLVKPKMPH